MSAFFDGVKRSPLGDTNAWTGELPTATGFYNTDSAYFVQPGAPTTALIQQFLRDSHPLRSPSPVAFQPFAQKVDVPPGAEAAFLAPLPIGRLWGVGDATREVLASIGLSTIGDIARYPERALVGRLGASSGHHLAALARGEDARPVVSDHEAVTVGQQKLSAIETTRAEQTTELAARRAAWKAPAPRYTSGVLAKYAKLVSSAAVGAVTD